MPNMVMNWNSLHCGKITTNEILQYCIGEDWQKLRRELKGTTLEEKYRCLRDWLESHNHSRAAQVQVTNYINALRRAGLI